MNRIPLYIRRIEEIVGMGTVVTAANGKSKARFQWTGPVPPIIGQCVRMTLEVSDW